MTRARALAPLAGYLRLANDDFANTCFRVPLGERAPAASGAGTAPDAVRRRSSSSPLSASSFFVPLPRALCRPIRRRSPVENFPRARGLGSLGSFVGRIIPHDLNSLERYSQPSHASRAHEIRDAYARTRTLVTLSLLGRLGSFFYVFDPARLNPSKKASQPVFELGRLGSFSSGLSRSIKIEGGYAARLAPVPDQGLDAAEAGAKFRPGGGRERIGRASIGVRALVGGNGGFPPFLPAPAGCVGTGSSEWQAKALRFQRFALIGHRLCRPRDCAAPKGDRSDRPGEGVAPPSSRPDLVRSLAQPFFWVSGLPSISAGRPVRPNGRFVFRSGWGTGRGLPATNLSGDEMAARRGAGMVQGSGHGRLRPRHDGAENRTMGRGARHVNA